MAFLFSAMASMVAPNLGPGLTPGGRAVAEKMAGVTAPFGFFDPMGLTPETNEELQLYREAELAHGRVAMVGALGFLVQEQFHPIFADIGGPAIRQLDLVLATPDGLTAGSPCSRARASSRRSSSPASPSSKPGDGTDDGADKDIASEGGRSPLRRPLEEPR